jgi:alkanesulfonate monooxygenase SsuD/methylene tetrahydromethanopterin reductase-like flavin-dependent oxidoreductase (luciferase family)
LESIEGGLLSADGSLDRYEDGNLIGPPEYIVDRLQEYREAGVQDWAGQIFVADTVDELLENLTVFSEKVMTKLD